MSTKRRVKPANPSPCAACPWRTENHGKRHPHGWYTSKNRQRLWSKLRRGDGMTCHPTDPENPLPTGSKPVPNGVTTHECAGALILQLRELEKCLKLGKITDYLAAFKRGLTKVGLAVIGERLAFGGIPMIGGLAVSKLDLNEGVSHSPLGEWEPKP